MKAKWKWCMRTKSAELGREKHEFLFPIAWIQVEKVSPDGSIVLKIGSGTGLARLVREIPMGF